MANNRKKGKPGGSNNNWQRKAPRPKADDRPVAESIQWFPGHMAKTRRLIAENAKNVHLFIEVLDARVPVSSRNPVLPELSLQI